MGTSSSILGLIHKSRNGQTRMASRFLREAEETSFWQSPVSTVLNSLEITYPTLQRVLRARPAILEHLLLELLHPGSSKWQEGRAFGCRPPEQTQGCHWLVCMDLRHLDYREPQEVSRFLWEQGC